MQSPHHRLAVITTDEIRNAQIVERLMRFRKSLFVDTLGWKLDSIGDLERDQFDTSDTVHVAVLDEANQVLAGFRACRTDKPYLASAVFPGLANERPYPQSSNAWEISRFGVAEVCCPRDRFRLAQVTYAAMIRFAQTRQASALVALADPVYERFLTRLQIATTRYGPPRIAAEDARGRPLRLLAGEIPISAANRLAFRRLLTFLQDVEMIDETSFFGPTAISA